MFYKTGLLSRGLTIERGLTFQYLRYVYSWFSLEEASKSSSLHMHFEMWLLNREEVWPNFLMGSIPKNLSNWMIGSQNGLENWQEKGKFSDFVITFTFLFYILAETWPKVWKYSFSTWPQNMCSTNSPTFLLYTIDKVQ